MVTIHELNSAKFGELLAVKFDELRHRVGSAAGESVLPWKPLHELTLSNNMQIHLEAAVHPKAKGLNPGTLSISMQNCLAF